MKTIRHGAKAKDKILHVETAGCIVNIQVGLQDMHGRDVTAVEVIPDQYAGDEWILRGTSARSAGIQVIRNTPIEGQTAGLSDEPTGPNCAEGFDTGVARYYRFSSAEECQRWAKSGPRGRRIPVAEGWALATIGDEPGTWEPTDESDGAGGLIPCHIWTPERIR